MFINKNKTANIKGKEGDITLHCIDILSMYCRVISPSFLFLQFKLCDVRIVNLTRRCKPLVFLPFIHIIDNVKKACNKLLGCQYHCK